MKLPRRRLFCIWPRALPRCRPCRGSRGRKPIRRARCAIVPGAAGNTTDILARLLGQWLSERLGQPFVIENRPGGGGNIATEAVVSSAPDGYTLLLIDAGELRSTPRSTHRLNFNFIRDIAPVASICRVPNVHRGQSIVSGQDRS